MASTAGGATSRYEVGRDAVGIDPPDAGGGVSADGPRELLESFPRVLDCGVLQALAVGQQVDYGVKLGVGHVAFLIGALGAEVVRV